MWTDKTEERSGRVEKIRNRAGKVQESAQSNRDTLHDIDRDPG